MDLGALFPWLLAAHVLLAISLFMPSFLLPFTFRFRRRGYAESPETEPGRIVRALLWLQGHGTVIIGTGVAVTGLGPGRSLKSVDLGPESTAVIEDGVIAAQRAGERDGHQLPAGMVPLRYGHDSGRPRLAVGLIERTADEFISTSLRRGGR